VGTSILDRRGIRLDPLTQRRGLGYPESMAHPIRVYLEKRGETQSSFAMRVGLSKPYLSQVISGRERLGAEGARKIVKATHGALSFEDLLEWEPPGGRAA